jgi:hypothetical protein
MNVEFSESLEDPRFQASIGPENYKRYCSDDTGERVLGEVTKFQR